MAEQLKVREFKEIPSLEEFESQIEPQNIPIVFRGCVKDWKAFSSWNPTNGGLDYLQERVGSAVVEVMLSRSAPVFNGDIRSHERVPVPFSSFIGLCKRGPCSSSEEDSRDVSESEIHQSAGPDADLCSSLTNGREQIYLAQVPILNREDEEKVQLESLRGDIKLPSFLASKKLSSINLWMNNAQSRSTSHYDPHHNLLCIVAGCKQVLLWPPSASPMLYPMPIYGEASNHSSVALESPDFSTHPRFERAHEYSQKVSLQAGDALFIPEGWFHQVDSDALTIAVNIWWRSNMMSSMMEHMDVYYLRRILRRLIDKEMNQMLPKPSGSGSDNMSECTSYDSGKADSLGDKMHQKNDNKLKLDIKLHDLGPRALKTLHELVSLVHAKVNFTNQEDQSSSTSGSAAVADVACEKVMTMSYSLEDDSVANILWNLEPLTLRAVFLAMVHNFPRTLEALIVHLLSPLGAEVLTRKFDELDQQMTEEERSMFYQQVYSVFDDPSSAMDALLNGKESFALQAFKNVLELYMGITLNGSSYRLR